MTGRANLSDMTVNQPIVVDDIEAHLTAFGADYLKAHPESGRDDLIHVLETEALRAGAIWWGATAVSDIVDHLITR